MMVKKNRQEKEKLRLRREAEVLKAQAKATPTAPAEVAEKDEVSSKVNPDLKQVETKYIKRDLLKSLFLTIAALAIIAAFYLLQK